MLSGQVGLSGEVLVYDENGQHQGPSVAEFLAARGVKVTFVVPDRMPAVELGATNSAQFMKALYAAGVRFVPDLALRGVRRDGNRLVATLQEHVHRAASKSCAADHVVVEHGTVPADELYLGLKAGSRNHGEIDLDALLTGRPQALIHNPDGALPAVPGRRRRHQPQHPRRDLRLACACARTSEPCNRQRRTRLYQS